MKNLKNFDKMHAIGCACCGGVQGVGPSTAGTSFSRRGVLRGAMAGMAAGVLSGLALGASRRAWADDGMMSPEAALQALVEGNERFVAKKFTFLEQDLNILKQNTVAKQEPFAAVLSCADSRVPVELAFDQSIGHVFVARVAGNIATGENIASLEYGAAVLGTKVIMVLGHSNCGAVKATIDGKPVPGQISSLYAHIRPAVDAAGSDLEAAIKANARIQANLLATASPVLAGLIKEKKLRVVAGYYNLADGKVSVLG
ncbi:MAG TPA: carbonic anhydrase [Dongiaceae bacterium]|nr:carbonic anhydrase [Dongiaceae bacterium]